MASAKTTLVEVGMDTLTTATILATLVLLASMASVELGISVAIIEIGLGVFAGNVLACRAGRGHRRRGV